MAKIEKPKALERLDEILELADALMVARGDLGVELPLETVPGRQKEMTRMGRRARQAGGGGHANAGIDDQGAGADAGRGLRRGHRGVRRRRRGDAVGGDGRGRLSGRSRHDDGQDRQCRGERSAIPVDPRCPARAVPNETSPDAILAAVHQVTHTIHARAIVCWTKSGSTGLRAARERPEAPILALTPSIDTARRLCLAWGLHCVNTEDAHDLDDVAERAAEIAYEQGFAKPGERIVITAGVPLGTPGATNLLRVAFIGGR